MLIHGNNLEELPKLPDNSIDAIITDPPYELGFMGKTWDCTGIAYNTQLWRECLRVLKPGGHLLAFSGSRTYHRLACAIEDAGFQIRDQIMWVYGSGFPKSLNVGNQPGCEEWEGWGTALKPAHEPIVLARKPLDGTVAQNVIWYGTGALNIDECRVRREPDDQSHAGHRTATFGDEQTVSGGDGSGGWSQNDAGRFPANLIHDGSDEVLELFPDTAGGARPAKANKPTGEHYEGGWGPISDGERVEFAGGSAARFFYCAKANKRDRNEGLDNFQPKRDADRIADDGVGGNNPRNRTNTPKLNHHPTVKPTELMRYLCRLITPPGGTILDPFTGSGSTGKAAILEGFNFIGIELDPDYITIAQARIDHAYTQRH